MLRSGRPLAILAVSAVVCASVTHRHHNSVLASAPSPAGYVRSASPMLAPRSGHTATLLPDGKVLIAGGMRRNQDFYNSAELYDPGTGKFQPTGSMSIMRVGAAAVLLHAGKVLIVGGWVGHGATASAELYDPTTGKFSALPSMTAKRGRPSCTLLADGDVLIAGGADHDAPGGIASAELFHAVTQNFEPLAPMHFARISQTATVLNDGRVLIAGGRGDAVNSSAELYDPVTKHFTLTGGLLTARYKHSAGLLPDGRVLIAGGSDEHDWHGQLSSAEIYDPGTGKFSAASPLNDGRFKLPEEAVQVTSGALLVAGGSKTVELYNPASGTFLVVAGQLNDARHYMTETKLKDGSVLLTGGYPDNDQATAETWIYHP
jgi:Kelch motif/Galactose oxidase, central domain